VIQIVDVHKRYRQGDNVVRALDGVSLTIDRGELVAVVGRSGSGKTTLLDVLGLILRPTVGRILMDGEDVGGLSDRRRAHLRAARIGFVFQEYNLLPTMTAVENVMLPMRYGGSRAGGRRQRAASLLEQVGLLDRAGHRPDQLSGGQQQRVAIARSLANGPELVLADEPTGAVDSETGERLVALTRRMNEEHGVTFVIVTHDLDLAARTNRVIRLRDGRVVADELAPTMSSGRTMTA
jgi:putative ABC transport system ATP-binding protein